MKAKKLQLADGEAPAQDSNQDLSGQLQLPVEETPTVQSELEAEPIQLPEIAPPVKKRIRRTREQLAEAGGIRLAGKVSPKSDAPDKRAALKALFTRSAEKFFALLERYGASPLDNAETLIVNECIEINVDLIPDDKIDTARKYARYVSFVLVAIIIITRIRQIIAKVRNRKGDA